MAMSSANSNTSFKLWGERERGGGGERGGDRKREVKAPM